MFFHTELIFDETPPVIDTILKRPDALLVINLSGGKDSYAMLRYLVRFHAQQGYQAQIVAVHANLGLAEWEGTEAIIHAQCSDVGVPLTVVRRSRGGLVKRLWQRWQTLQAEGKDVPPFSDSKNRFCTSDTKAQPIDKFIRTFSSRIVVNAMGLRAEESTKRAKKPVCAVRSSITTKPLKKLSPEEAWERWRDGRLAIDWLPIHHFPLERVWQEAGSSGKDLERRQRLFNKGKIDEALRGWRNHYAYVLGNRRLSCALCVFAGAKELARGASYHPLLYANYRKLEEISGYQFKKDLSLQDIPLFTPTISAQTLACLLLELREE